MASALNGNIMEIYWGYRLTGWWFGTMEFYDFPYIGNFIIPTDFHSSFFRGVGQPPTSLRRTHRSSTNAGCPPLPSGCELNQQELVETNKHIRSILDG